MQHSRNVLFGNPKRETLHTAGDALVIYSFLSIITAKHFSNNTITRHSPTLPQSKVTYVGTHGIHGNDLGAICSCVSSFSTPKHVQIGQKGNPCLLVYLTQL